MEFTGESLPDRVGPYKVLEKLGEGGMGTVVLAQQETPVRRKVALKIIKLGMNSKEVIGRFEIEQQALALMNHANIAHVFDAGMTDAGRPFFVMEHVPGVPLTDYCDRHRLSTEERLELFIPVCEALHHAHQKGVIHRDIKPSNILVTVVDGKPEPKVIDFGVAKAINQRLSQETVFTEQGRMIGTPAYMSPEQAEMTGLNVDTTTDIYSLGVLLYELLTGAMPFDPRILQEAGLVEFERVIREVDPPRPSTKISTLGEKAPYVALKRRTEPASLEGALRGEVDWIIMRAMEKDRTRRYQSASELAADVRRHLENQPILAGPPDTMYQLKKMIARHTGAFAFAITVVVLLIGFGVSMSVLYRRADRAEQTAEAEAERARIEAGTADHVSDFLVGLFEVSDPGEARGRTITAIEILETGAERIERELADQPVVRARLMDTMGNVYMNLGLYKQAEELMMQALEIRRDRVGPESVEAAGSLSRLGYLRFKQGRAEEALALAREALAVQEHVLGPEHLDTAWSHYCAGAALAVIGQAVESRKHLREAQRVFEQKYGSEHLSVAWCLTDMAITFGTEGAYDSAVVVSGQAYVIKNKLLPEDHPDISIALNSLGYGLILEGRPEEAEPVLSRSLSISERAFGMDHPATANVLHSLGELYRQMGKYDRAEPLLRRALAIQEKDLAPNDAYLALTVHSLALAAIAMGRYAESESLHRRCLGIHTSLGNDVETARCLNDYADLLRLMDRSGDADSLILRADSIRPSAARPTGAP